MKTFLYFSLFFSIFLPTEVLAIVMPEKAKLQMVTGKIQLDGSGEGSMAIKIPGTVGDPGARTVEGGSGWFETPNHDDLVKISLVDNDNIIGSGSGYEVGTFHDAEVPAANQGWRIPYHDGVLRIDKIAESTRLMGGLYLNIDAKTGDGTADVFRFNIKWGKPE